MKTIITFIILLINFIANGQNFPGTEVSLLLGKEIKVQPKDEAYKKYGYDYFYKDDKLKDKFSCCDSYNTKYESLVGKIFTVSNIEPYKDLIKQDKFILTLKNPELGKVYFLYDPLYEHNFVFEVIGGLKLPEGFYCREIEMVADKFTGDTTYSTKLSDGVSFVKVKKGTSNKIYLSLILSGSTLNINQKGFILLLENNQRIERPDATIDVRASSLGSGYVYSVFIELTEIDKKILLNNAITDARLYIYDRSIKNGKRLIEYLNCLALK